MQTQSVRVELDEHVATVTLNRPERLNALDEAVLDRLHEIISSLGEPGSRVRAVVLTGEGKAFVAGADIAAMVDMDEARARAFSRKGHAVLDALERAPFASIAAVGGHALGGGCELVLACDFAIASERARFGQPELRLGVIPGFGGTQRLPRRIGPAAARRLVLTGESIDAAEALRLGLVEEVVPHEELLPRARRIAAQIAAMAPQALVAARRVMREGLDRPLEEACRLETEAFAACFSTGETVEGMRAFLEKRPARFGSDSG
ncbi:MAG: enoyl-CoA hydratase-related protein [Myxococcota bacterium]|nr:enoyl-CoA hydratase-related protein [Myxococcota bacterium]MDW8360953.1 enoyl-CoA hydratase-related protein [Myxococcales bacterium]